MELTNKTCIVTGANSGIGFAVAKSLAKANAKVIMVCRNKEKGESARDTIVSLTGNHDVTLKLVDLSLQSSIRAFVAEFKQQHSQLHVLINNAGLVNFKRKETNEGIEEMLAVNYLAAFHLTNLLVDLLKKSVPSKIINIVGEYHRKGIIDFEDFQAKNNYSAISAGANRVLAKTIFSHELARRLDGSGVTVNGLHPGAVRTGIQNKLPLYLRVLAVPLSYFFQSPDTAADYVINLTTNPDLEHFTGKYFNKDKEEESSPATHDKDLAKQLWDLSEKLTERK